MKRTPYFPRVVAERPEWFQNLGNQLPIKNTDLLLPAADVTNRVADALDLFYITGAWATAAREMGRTATLTIAEAYFGTGTTPLVLPGFNPPDRPVGIVAVPPGALQRIFDFVQIIKRSPHYTDAIGASLRILGEEDDSEPGLPSFKITVERGAGTCECAKIRFQKNGNEGVAIFSRRGPAGVWEMLAIDLHSPYLDERPLLVPGTPEVREYQLQAYNDNAPTGPFTEPQSVTLAP